MNYSDSDSDLYVSLNWLVVGTLVFFSIQLEIIIPTDLHIFQRS